MAATLKDILAGTMQDKKDLHQWYSNLLSMETGIAKSNVSVIDHHILTAKLELFRLRAVLVGGDNYIGTATDEVTISSPFNSHTPLDDVSAESLEGSVAAVPVTNKSWVEFEQQFVKPDEHDSMPMDCSDWSIEDATNILSNNYTKAAHDQVSRFYTKRTIIIGNTSQYLKKGVRSASNNPGATHKWMVYVRNIENEPQLQSYVKSVCFFLHPSYAPNDIVNLSRPPFQLTQFGWGEFPVRVQLFFKDPVHKPIDIIHNLKLDHTHTGQQMLGSETTTDIELLKVRDDHHSELSNTMISDTEGLTNVFLTNDTIPAHRPNSCNKSTCQAIWQSVHGAAKRVPLYGNDGTNREFNSYNIVKQRALEWMRAIDIKKLLQGMQIPEADKLSTREIVTWCRMNGHTPHPSQRLHNNTVQYCKHCGQSATPPHHNCHSNDVVIPLNDVMMTMQYREVNLDSIDMELMSNHCDQQLSQQSLRYRVPRSPELKWVHETCKSIEVQLYPQSHDGMLLHVVDHMIFSATSQFLYELLKSVITMETTPQSWTDERVIVPYMICSALRELDVFDIITNKGMMFST